MANHLSANEVLRAAWEARKLAQEQAYAAMKKEMVNIICRIKAIAKCPEPNSRDIAEVVDRLCDLYSTYCDRWETY
jgi:hypothetical protein